MGRQTEISQGSLNGQREVAYRVRKRAIEIEDDGLARLEASHQAATPALAASRMAAMFFA